MTLTAETDSRRRAAWSADPCTCGCPRAGHKLTRQPYPATVRRYGRCAGCGNCTGFDIDEAALVETERVILAERRAGVAAILAAPVIGRWR